MPGAASVASRSDTSYPSISIASPTFTLMRLHNQMTRNIPGLLDYRVLAGLNRHRDPVAFQREVRRLAATGMTALDVGH
jgi:hypothetical protein